jgi:hypothetical protein
MFQRNNRGNPTEILVSICDENGLWIEDDFTCNLGSIY